MNIRRWVAVALGPLVMVTGVIAACVTSAPQASAATTVTPAQRTCTAFREWQARPTPGRLNRMMRDSVSAPWVPLGTDVVVLYTDVRDGNTYDRTADVSAIASDCKGH